MRLITSTGKRSFRELFQADFSIPRVELRVHTAVRISLDRDEWSVGIIFMLTANLRIYNSRVTRINSPSRGLDADLQHSIVTGNTYARRRQAAEAAVGGGGLARGLQARARHAMPLGLGGHKPLGGPGNTKNDRE
jgi:hypothetical protein